MLPSNQAKRFVGCIQGWAASLAGLGSATCEDRVERFLIVFELHKASVDGTECLHQNFAQGRFERTKTLAANQGLYNAFLVAGLVWSLLIADVEWSKNVALFFLGCVAVAGIYGGLTAKMRILYVQGLPAIIAMAVVYFLG